MNARAGIRRSSRGIALLEAAIVLPLILFLFVGMTEFGFALRDGNTLSRAVQASARTDARLADDPLADYEALRAIESGLSALGSSSIERVIVYDANGTGATPPADCLAVVPSTSGAAGVGGLCNVYSPTQVAADQPGSFGCGGGWDSNFCPINTSHRQRNGNNPTRVGVWVELTFDGATSVLPTSVSLTRGAVYQLEPCVAGAASC